jgi:hypothetical protein
MLHDFNQILTKPGVNPRLIAMSVKEMMHVVIIPMIIAKAILFFM